MELIEGTGGRQDAARHSHSHSHSHGHAHGPIETQGDDDIVIVRPEKELFGRQALPYFVGISGASAGAKGISMNLVVIPPSGAAEPHSHRGFESAVYMAQGRVLVRYGAGLAKSQMLETGEFLFIPPDMPHQPVNLSATEVALAIVARNDPNEQESIERFYDVRSA